MAEHNHIEEFFRKRLASHDFTFQEEDWMKLEQKLEMSGFPSNPTAATHFSIKTIIIIVAALTAAFILGWIAREMVQNKKNESGELLKNETLPSRNIADNAPVKDPPAETTSQDFQQKIEYRKEENMNPEGVKKNPQEVNISPAEAKGYSEVAKEHPELTNKNLEGANINPPGVIEYSEVVEMDPEGVIEFSKEGIEYPEETALDEVSGNRIKETEDWEFKPQPVIRNHLALNPNPELPLLYSPETSEPLTVKTPVSRWSIGLLIAPDFNSIGFLRRKTISPVVGGLVSFNVTPRWSLSARVLYNNKKYSSRADYYNVPYDYWPERTNGVIPDNIDGSCRVLDIPILLTYRFYVRQRFSLTASAGPGSYFLFDEKYEFTFKQNNPGAATQWNTKEDSKVLFGVANIALGIDMQTGRRTSVAIEPYLKIPLKQMGWANVNLSGMGLSFSLKYHFK